MENNVRIIVTHSRQRKNQKAGMGNQPTNGNNNTIKQGDTGALANSREARKVSVYGALGFKV